MENEILRKNFQNFVTDVVRAENFPIRDFFCFSALQRVDDRRHLVVLSDRGKWRLLLGRRCEDIVGRALEETGSQSIEPEVNCLRFPPFQSRWYREYSPTQACSGFQHFNAKCFFDLLGIPGCVSVSAMKSYNGFDAALKAILLVFEPLLAKAMSAASDLFLLPDPDRNLVGESRRLRQKKAKLGGLFEGRVDFRKTGQRSVHVFSCLTFYSYAK